MKATLDDGTAVQVGRPTKGRKARKSTSVSLDVDMRAAVHATWPDNTLSDLVNRALEEMLRKAEKSALRDSFPDITVELEKPPHGYAPEGAADAKVHVNEIFVGSVTLAPNDFGELDTWGTIDMWADADIQVWLRGLDIHQPPTASASTCPFSGQGATRAIVMAVRLAALEIEG